MIPSEPIDCPYYLVTKASLGVTALLKQKFAAAGVKGVKPAYLGVLWCLWREDDVKVVDLGRCAGLEPSTMTGLLDRMERNGLVRRALDPKDRRAQRIQLTVHGREMKDRVIDVLDKTLERAFGGVSEQQLSVLKETLRKVLINTNRQAGA